MKGGAGWRWVPPAVDGGHAYRVAVMFGGDLGVGEGGFEAASQLERVRPGRAGRNQPLRTSTRSNAFSDETFSACDL